MDKRGVVKRDVSALETLQNSQRSPGTGGRPAGPAPGSKLGGLRELPQTGMTRNSGMEGIPDESAQVGAAASHHGILELPGGVQLLGAIVP